MGLLDKNYQDQRLTASQKKKIKPAIQGGGYNYLGKQEEVTVPRKWLSDPDHVVAELAYITPREKKVLIDLNMYGSLDGKPNNAPGGLPSLQGDMGSVSGGGTSGGNGGDPDNTREQYGAKGQYDGGTKTGDGGGGYTPPTIEPPYVMVGGQKFAYDDPKAIEAENVIEKESIVEKALDLYSQYSPLANVLNLGKNVLSTIGDLSTVLQNKAIEFDLTNRLEKAYQDPTFDPFTPDDSVTQLEQDLAKARSGDFTQSEYEDKYGVDLSDGESKGGNEAQRAIQTALTPYAPYAITGTTPQQSMVNQYFANLNLGQALSSDLQTSYNNAKNNVNSLLGITPPSQQFGYSTQPYGLLSSTNLAANPFNIDYLRTRGLI